MRKAFFCFALCLIVSVAMQAVGQDEVENLVNNWDFENRVVNPWSPTFKPDAGGDAVLLIDDDEFFTGEVSMKIEINEGGDHKRAVHVIQQPLMGPVKTGRDYTYCAWVKAEEERTIFMNLMQSVVGGNITTPNNKEFTVGPEWRECWFTVEATANEDIRVEFEVGLSDADIWVDHIRFYEGDYVDEGLGEPQAIVRDNNSLVICWSRIKAGK